MTDWITVRHPDVEGTAVVASTALISLPGWFEVEPAPLVLDVPTGTKASTSRKAPTTEHQES